MRGPNLPSRLLVGLRGTIEALWTQFVRIRQRSEPIFDRGGLRRFLHTRSNYVAQYALYGYLRTRSGVRFPELFNDDPFVRAINIAKWHIWLACLSDLAVYAGGLILQRTHAPIADVSRLISDIVEGILHEVGAPEDAGPQFAEHAARLRARIALCDWKSIGDDESAFTESPVALVRWAPVTEELKVLDEEIVKNSVRFRWQDIRRALRNDLDATRVLDRPAR
jgi:hypothetical protein